MRSPFALLNTWSRLQRRAFWWLLSVLAATVLYALLATVLVPIVARSQLVHFADSQFHRPLTIGKIRFNPFTLTIDIHDLSFPDRDSQPMIAMKRLMVDFEVSSIWHRGLAFGDIFLTEPFGKVVIHDDGTLNLLDLVPKSKPDDAKASSPLRLFIGHLQVINGRTAFEDRHRSQPFTATLQPINFDLRDFSTLTDSDNAFRLAAKSAAGEQFSWSGQFEVAPLSSTGKFSIEHLQATTLRDYLSNAISLDVSSGIIDLNGDYSWNATSNVGAKLNVEQLKMANLHLRPLAANEDYVQLDQITVAGVQVDTAQKQVSIKSLNFDGGKIHAWLDAQSRLNLQDLAPESAPAATTAPTSQTPTAPWVLSIAQIALNALHVDAEDRHITPVAAFAINPLALTVKDFSTARGSHAIAELSATLVGTESSHGQLHVNANVDLDTQAVTGTADINGIDLTLIQPYLVQRTAMTLLSGGLNAKLAFSNDRDHGMRVTGDTEIAKLHTIDNELKEDFINWERLRLDKFDYRSKPSSLRIAAITAQAPYARVIINSEQKLNISQVLRSPATPESEEASTNASATAPKPPENDPNSMAITVGVVRIENGAVNYADYWIKPNFATAVQSIEGTVKGLSSQPNSRATLVVDGKVDRYSPVHIDGEVNPLAAAAYGDIKMNFRNLDLTAVTPYSGHFAGYKIVKGQLSATVAYHIENRALQASHRFVIDELQLGDKVESADAVSLPLKLAVALLKDRNGVIDLELPVTGSLDDPKFKVGPIIWQVFKGLITKAATAPFRMLANLFGGGEDMNLIDFKPGSAALDEAALTRLRTVTKALRERQRLELDVPMTYSEADRPALAHAKLQQRLLALKRAELKSRKQSDTVDESILADPAEHFRLSLTLFRQNSPRSALPSDVSSIEAALNKKEAPSGIDAATQVLDAAILASITVDDGELEALGKTRASAIQDLLLNEKEIDAARVFVIASPPVAPVNGSVRAELSLK